MNPITRHAITGHAGASGACPCHDLLDCPDQTTIPIRAATLAEAAALLAVVDEFLRSGTDVAEKLTDFCARRGQIHPRFAANNLIDEVSFTAGTLRQHLTRHRDGGHR